MVVGISELVGQRGHEETQERHGADERSGHRHEDGDEEQRPHDLAAVVDPDVVGDVLAERDHVEPPGAQVERGRGDHAERDGQGEVLDLGIGHRPEQSGGENIELTRRQQSLHERGDRRETATDDDADQQHHLNVGVSAGEQPAVQRDGQPHHEGHLEGELG